MVRTRRQADAEGQAADPTLMAPTVNPIPSTPASAPRKEEEANELGSKKLTVTKATAKKATSTKATAKNQSSKIKSVEDEINSRSTSSGEKDHSIANDTARAGLVAKRPKTPAKKGQRKKTIKEIIKPPSKEYEVRDIETPGAKPTKKEAGAKPKATRTKCAIESDTAEKDGVSAVGHPQGKSPAAKNSKASSPAGVPPSGEIDPDITETDEDLEQRIKDYEKRKRKQAPTGGEADPDITETEEELEQRIIDYEKRKRKEASKKRKAPIAEVTAGQQSAEPPKKKTKRSAIKTAAAKKVDPNDELEKDRPSGYSSKKAAAATKKAAKLRKLQTEPTPGTRKSARISGNLDIFSSGDESKPVRRPLKVRFRKRTKTPDIPNNQIGLDENEIFSPRFPIDKPKSGKVVKKTHHEDDFPTEAEQRRLRWEAKRRTLTSWERTTIARLTERLIAQKESESGDGPNLVDELLPLRFERGLLDSSGHGIVELGPQDSEAQMPTLTNDIHPIWASRNCTFSKGPSDRHRAYSQRVYEAISPALRLASHWIEAPEFEAFWHTLWIGSLGQNKRTSAVTIHARGPGGVYGKTPFHKLKIARSEQPNKDKAANLMLELAELESLEWRFEPTKTKYEGLSTTEGQVSTLHDWFERDILYDSMTPLDSARNTSERLRVLFFLAVHLCRQLVQQVYHHLWARDFGDVTPPVISKVLFENADGASDFLEVAWDTFMFTGCIVQMNSHQNTQVDCPDGLCIALGRRAAGWKGCASPKAFAAVPMRWINDLFLDTHWSHKRKRSYFPRLPHGNLPYCAAGPFT